jgi:carbon-monoxide dehydrogenase small subunit
LSEKDFGSFRHKNFRGLANKRIRGSLMKQVRLTVNGASYEPTIKPWETLIDVLRDNLGLTGTKEGCGLGECGACTVIMDGKAVNSCLVLAAEVDGKQITTIEGLVVQAAFIEHGGLQCGFCTPGMIMSAKALLDENSNPSEGEIKRGIAGNFCRCTGYTKIIESIKAAAKNMQE